MPSTRTDSGPQIDTSSQAHGGQTRPLGHRNCAVLRDHNARLNLHMWLALAVQNVGPCWVDAELAYGVAHHQVLGSGSLVHDRYGVRRSQ